MLRTNSKKAAENIRKYIMEDLEYLQERADYDGIALEENNADQVLAYAYNVFKAEKRGEIERYRNINLYKIFQSWAPVWLSAICFVTTITGALLMISVTSWKRARPKKQSIKRRTRRSF